MTGDSISVHYDQIPATDQDALLGEGEMRKKNLSAKKIMFWSGSLLLVIATLCFLLPAIHGTKENIMNALNAETDIEALVGQQNCQDINRWDTRWCKEKKANGECIYDNILRQCKETCGWCSGRIHGCKDVPDESRCEELNKGYRESRLEQCDRNDWIRQRCRATCGRCSSGRHICDRPRYMGGLNCQQICIKDGSNGKCACNPTHQLRSDGKSCKELHPCDKADKGGCQHNCIKDGKNAKCECNPNYQLQSDGKSCKEIHPCDREDKGGCDHTCIKDGKNAKCECNTTYQLKSDGKSCAVCFDVHPEACQFWKQKVNNFCDVPRIYNDRKAIDECRATCGFCSTSDDGLLDDAECNDESTRCQYYIGEKKNFCASEEAKDMCEAACGLCTPCKDKWDLHKCRHHKTRRSWAQSGRAFCDHRDGKDLCRKTCGHCSTPIKDVCEDRWLPSQCLEKRQNDGSRNFCQNIHRDQRTLAKENCKDTCGFCYSSKPKCMDEESLRHCESLKREGGCVRKRFIKRCKETCGWCSGGEIHDCRDLWAPFQCKGAIRRHASRCDYDPNFVDNCRKTCGKCSSKDINW